MKYIIKSLILVVMLAFTGVVHSQDVNGKLADAKSAYKQGNLDDTRMSLQDALDQVNMAIGKEILGVLPAKMGNMAFTEADDNITSTSAGFAGLYVNRSYGKSDGDKKATIQIVSDSPLMAGINTILSMPLMGKMGDPNQKRIKVDGYKALLQKTEGSEGNPPSYDVQIPFGSSMLTFHCDGVSNEEEIISMANTIPMSKIVKLSK
jgi:hypothetical protein